MMDERLRDKLIDELSSLAGIVSEYWDIFGKKYIASIDSKSKLLQAMGFDINSNESISKEINRLETFRWTRFIEPVYVVNEQPFNLFISLGLEKEQEHLVKIKWDLIDDTPKGLKVRYEALQVNILEENLIDGQRYVRIALPFTYPNGVERFEIGYYRLNVTVNIGDNHISGQSKIIICPKHCYFPFDNNENTRLWGLSINLYSLRSKYNWGIGDLGDLKGCIKEIKRSGGSFVGINPLHSITNQRPYGISPYSPISKFYKNFIYINIKDVEGYEEIEIPKALRNKINDLRNSQYIDYEGLAHIKINILKKLFDWFYREHYVNSTQLAIEFVDFINKEGELLNNYALYCAIAEHEGKAKGINMPLYSWRQWDQRFHSPYSEDSIRFKDKHKKIMLFYCYLQWLVERQLKDIQECSHPMPIGIYNDLAVGSIRDGYDEWVYQHIFASSVNVGAPPDDFNPLGQDWGFPPLCPIRLRDSAYEPLIMILRKNMSNAGALRIDHALGLFRMYWIPVGNKASEGVYVEYPFEEIIGIIALESHLNKTLIIAEDLGTITDIAREQINKSKMFSYKLLYFQRRYPDPSFLLPDEYPQRALCTVTTHDLPTIKGFWNGVDIVLRRSLHLFKNEEEYIKTQKERQRDKELLISILKQAGIIDFDVNDIDTRLIISIYEFLARTRSILLAVNLDDIMETIDQQNMPGTVDEYPCWRQKTPKYIEEFWGGQDFIKLVETLKRSARSVEIRL